MRTKNIVVALLAAALSCAVAWADQIVLKNGQRYSGKFIQGDTSVVQFRILGRVESFKVSEVSQIIFQEPELTPPPAPAKVAPPPVPVQAAPPAVPVQAAPPPVPAKAVPVQAQPVVSRDNSAVTFPVGTTLTIRTTTPIDTDTNKVGDTFTTTLEEPLTSGDRVIVPKGTEVKGEIASAKESGKVTGQSELILELTELNYNGHSYVLRTSDYSEVGASRGTQTAKAAGGGAAIGAIIGAIAGGGKGAAIGAASGAALGTGVQVMTRGQTLKIPAETLLRFTLEHELVIN